MGNIKADDLIAKPARRAAKRAVRAHHELRMRAKVRKFFPEMNEKWVCRMANNRKTCSHPWCCGNPRKIYGDSWKDICLKAAFNLDMRD